MSAFLRPDLLPVRQRVRAWHDRGRQIVAALLASRYFEILISSTTYCHARHDIDTARKRSETKVLRDRFHITNRMHS